MKDKLPPKIFFNASVILAGLRNPNGGSGILLEMVRNKKIAGMVSEIIVDEVIRNLPKIRKNEKIRELSFPKFGFKILPAPQKEEVEKYYSIVTDLGDAHVLASAKLAKADYLVSLDKKHILILNGKIKDIKIYSPAQLLGKLG